MKDNLLKNLGAKFHNFFATGTFDGTPLIQRVTKKLEIKKVS